MLGGAGSEIRIISSGRQRRCGTATWLRPTTPLVTLGDDKQGKARQAEVRNNSLTFMVEAHVSAQILHLQQHGGVSGPRPSRSKVMQRQHDYR